MCACFLLVSFLAESQKCLGFDSLLLALCVFQFIYLLINWFTFPTCTFIFFLFISKMELSYILHLVATFLFLSFSCRTSCFLKTSTLHALFIIFFLCHSFLLGLLFFFLTELLLLHFLLVGPFFFFFFFYVLPIFLIINDLKMP